MMSLMNFMNSRKFSSGLNGFLGCTFGHDQGVAKRGDFSSGESLAVNIIKISIKAILIISKNCIKNRYFGVLAFIAFTSPASQVMADEKPLWELGAGVSGIRLPVYRGSDEFRNIALPLPYFVYRGERLKLDREGGRGMLFKTDNLELDISVSGSIPVSSSSNSARAGMPGLKGTLEVGPLLIASLWRSADKNAGLTARIPFRGVMTSGFDGAGFVFQPQLAYDVRNLAGTGWVAGIRGGPVFQSGAYANYFYGVPQAFSTVNRASYQGSSGYGGFNVLVGGSKRYGNVWVGAFAKYDNLSGASFEDSPLVRKKQFVTLGLAMSWIFTQSSTMVQADD
jgi:MipA family protein